LQTETPQESLSLVVDHHTYFQVKSLDYEEIRKEIWHKVLPLSDEG